MDVATVLGVGIGLFVMIFSVVAAGASLNAFFNWSAALCVVGGSIAALLVCTPLRTCLGLTAVLRKAFLNQAPHLGKLIDLIVGLAETARRDGLLALDEKIPEIKDPFIVLGLQMAVDGTRPESIEEIMKTHMEAVALRHKEGKNMLDQLGKSTPAFGMIGTLLGLVIMLGNMSDPNAIGPGMAVALLTTLYGAVLSNLICLPMAEKLNFINKQELVAMDIVLRGIMSIQSGDNPRIISQKLSTFLSPKQRAEMQYSKAA